MHVTDTCVFCGIISGTIPASIVYQDDDTVAFLDLYPVHPGHTLVVPRLHLEDLVSCPPGVCGQLFEASAKLAPAVVQAANASGFNIWTANGRAAGQQVFHLHLHILPRFDEDAFGLRFPKNYPQRASTEELDRMAEAIRRRA